MEKTRFLLDEADAPATWYNLAADLPGPPPAPALNPTTRKPLTRGAQCGPSALAEVVPGRIVAAADPDCPGGLGIATSEPLEASAKDPSLGYAVGSAGNHVLPHQTVIAQEAMRQPELAGDYPDV